MSVCVICREKVLKSDYAAEIVRKNSDPTLIWREKIKLGEAGMSHAGCFDEGTQKLWMIA